MHEFSCVDIITTDQIGISVWANEIPEDDCPNDGPLGDHWLDIVYPAKKIPSVQSAIEYAKQLLGEFSVKNCG